MKGPTEGKMFLIEKIVNKLENTSSKTCNLDVDDAFRNRYTNVIGCFLYLVTFVSGSCFLGREPFQHTIMPILQLATEITSFASKLQRLYQDRKIVVSVRTAINLSQARSLNYHLRSFQYLQTL